MTRIGIALSSCLILFACSDSKTMDSGTGQSGSDASRPSDGGTVGGDANPGSDASSNDTGGNARDGGVANDAASGQDASQATDGGNATDATPPADATTADATPPPDTGSAVDAASAADAGLGNTSCNPTLGANDACGGNLVGNWTYIAACTNEDFLDDFRQVCPGAVSSNEVRSTSGTLALNANGIFTRSVTDTATGNLSVPASCAGLVGGCSGVESAIEAGRSNRTANCTSGGGGSCNCAVTWVVTTVDTGSYTTGTGGVVTAFPSQGGMSQYYYCVDINVLKYRGFSSNGDGDRLSYVLTR